MKRAIAYARFSSDLQREESIDAQLRAIRKYCDEQGFVLLATYADKGISGTSDNRPEFQKMIAAATKGDVDAVIVHKLDRFSRNRYDAAVYRNVLKKNGIKLISVLENIQGDSPENVLLESVLDGLSEFYSKNLSREVKKGLLENALACKVTGGPPALGYSVDRNAQQYIVNEYEAEAVRLIFSMYLEGKSYGEIISALNDKGYRTRRGLPFAKNSLHEILKNERYTGVYIYVSDTTKNPKGKYVCHGGEYDPEAIIRIPGGMPQLISKEDFERVQAKMRERQHKAAKFSAKQDYLLSGKIYCGECGSPFAGNSRKPRPDHPLYMSYKCTRRNQRDTKCKNPEINRDKLEQLVLERLSKMVFNPDVIPDLVKRYNEYVSEKTGSAKERMHVLETELRDTERKITNAVNLMIETGSSAFKNKLNELETTKERLSFELREADAAYKRESFSEKQIRELFYAAEQQLKNGTLTNRRLVIDQYINKVLIYPDKIEVYMNIMNDYTVKEVIEH